jgi:hypothetical protein
MTERATVMCGCCGHCGVVPLSRVEDMLTCLACGTRGQPAGWTICQPPKLKPSSASSKPLPRKVRRRIAVEAAVP